MRVVLLLFMVAFSGCFTKDAAPDSTPDVFEPEPVLNETVPAPVNVTVTETNTTDWLPFSIENVTQGPGALDDWHVFPVEVSQNGTVVALHPVDFVVDLDTRLSVLTWLDPSTSWHDWGVLNFIHHGDTLEPAGYRLAAEMRVHEFGHSNGDFELNREDFDGHIAPPWVGSIDDSDAFSLVNLLIFKSHEPAVAWVAINWYASAEGGSRAGAVQSMSEATRTNGLVQGSPLEVLDGYDYGYVRPRYGGPSDVCDEVENARNVEIHGDAQVDISPLDCGIEHEIVIRSPGHGWMLASTSAAVSPASVTTKLAQGSMVAQTSYENPTGNIAFSEDGVNYPFSFHSWSDGGTIMLQQRVEVKSTQSQGSSDIYVIDLPGELESVYRATLMECSRWESYSEVVHDPGRGMCESARGQPYPN